MRNEFNLSILIGGVSDEFPEDLANLDSDIGSIDVINSDFTRRRKRSKEGRFSPVRIFHFFQELLSVGSRDVGSREERVVWRSTIVLGVLIRRVMPVEVINPGLISPCRGQLFSTEISMKYKTTHAVLR